MTSRPLTEVLAEARAWTAATDEVIAAARELAHYIARGRFFIDEDTRLIRAVAAMEKLEQEAAERIRIERQQQERE